MARAQIRLPAGRGPQCPWGPATSLGWREARCLEHSSRAVQRETVRSSAMWFALLRLQPWKGLPESGRKQKISDLDPTFRALYTIIHWSHIGASRTHRDRKWDCFQGPGRSIMGSRSCSWQGPGAPKSPALCTREPPGPGVNFICLQGLGDRQATSCGNSGESPSPQPCTCAWCISASLDPPRRSPQAQ